MIIAVDGYEIGPVSTGVGRVIHNLVMEMSSFLPHQFLVVTRERVSDFTGRPNISSRVVPCPGGYFRWQNLTLRRELKKNKWDLFIAPNYTLPLGFRGPSVLLEHDISFVTHPGWFTRKEALKKKLLVGRSLKNASLIMTVSHFSRREILDCFPVAPGKIHVVHHGVENKFQPVSRGEVLKWKADNGFGDKKMIGFLGSIFNRRRLPLLVEAVEKVRDRIPVGLHIVGKDMTCPPQNIKSLLNRPWIRWDQELPDHLLPVFYSSLDVFAYLSEYEGFGLPPLEALSCETLPVLLNRTALAEIYPGIAVMVDQPKVDPVAAALISALTDESMRRSKMECFQRRRNYFTWKRAAEEWTACMEPLLEG